MAGIGFRLQKLLKEDTYTGLMKGYLYSAIISSGPMLVSIICIGVLGFLSFPVLNTRDYLLFRTTIIYIFSFSIIFTGVFQMITTRYVADRLYMKEPNSLIPCFMALNIITVINQTVIGALFFYHVDKNFNYVALSTSLYVIISWLWNTMIFISATKNYNTIVIGFVIGSILSVIGGHWAGSHYGLAGYIAGFSAGQFVIVVFLMANFFREFDFFKSIDFNFLNYFIEYPDLCFAGLIINLSVWADKFIFWVSPYGVNVQGLFYTFPVYDSAFFLAYLSIIPALSIFLVRVETSFYKKYRSFYQMVTGKASLYMIESAKDDIIRDLKTSMMILIKIQGTITVVLIAGAVKFIQIAKLQWIQLIIFKIGTLSAFVLIFFQLMVIIMFYFEFRKEALFLTLLFLVTNITATLVTLKFGFASFGYGFFAAGFVSLFCGYFVLNYKLSNLEYLTFASQPILKIKA